MLYSSVDQFRLVNVALLTRLPPSPLLSLSSSLSPSPSLLSLSFSLLLPSPHRFWTTLQKSMQTMKS